MKATTLIFIVIVAIGLWFLYNYMSQKSKIAEVYPGPGGVGVDPNLTGDTTVKPDSTTMITGVSAPLNRPVSTTLTSAMKVCFSQQVQDLVDEYNSIPITFFPNPRQRSIRNQLQSLCANSIQLLKN